VNPYRSGTIIDYVNGAGGRLTSLPGYMLDAAADAVTRINPRYLAWSVTDLLVSDRFVRSSHPKLSDVHGAADLRRRRRRGGVILCSSELEHDTISSS